jgi:precorrin-6Y C5,15-methyltransferase (decarboxylating)
VTVEAALCAYRGHVYAIERREKAAQLIEKNCGAFNLGNVTIVSGEAPAALEALPVPDAVFIGGSSGKIDAIVSAVLQKNPKARIVIAAITLETSSSALEALNKAGLEVEIVQLNIANSKKIGGLHMMESQNPVTVYSTGGNT